MPETRPLLVLVTGLPGTGKSTLADAAAGMLGSAVLAYDWAMSGLRPFAEVEDALEGMGTVGRREVGWSVLRAVARAQLRRGSSAVLDGVARQPQVTSCRALAGEEGASCLVVATTCADEELHRQRIEGRRRNIPDWYELDWEHVRRARLGWVALEDVDLLLDAGEPLEANVSRLSRLMAQHGDNEVDGTSLADAWEEHAAEWIAWARAPNHDGFWTGTWPELRSLVPEPEGPAIEIGCGEGRVSRHLMAAGHDVVAVERSRSLATAAATGEPPVAVARADAAALPVRTGCVALAVACHVLQDVDDLDATIREASRVLRPGGRLCFAVVHPFSSAQNPESMHRGGSAAVTVSDPYLLERRTVERFERDGLAMTFVSMHRPLSVYVNTLGRHGFAVDALRELGQRSVPWLLTGRAVKIGS